MGLAETRTNPGTARAGTAWGGRRGGSIVVTLLHVCRTAGAVTPPTAAFHWVNFAKL